MSFGPVDEFTYFRGRVALASILRSLGVGPKDEVALQAFTCVAVPEAVLAVGARPVWVDVGAASFTMDPGDLAQKLTSGTRAIIVQHTFGIPADLDPVCAVARAKGIPIIEDCAHAMSSTYAGRPVGTFGVAGCYSYEASKPLFVGLGGSARVNDEETRLRVSSHYGALTAPSRFEQFQLLAMLAAHRVAYRPSTYWTVRALFRKVSALGIIKGNYNEVGGDWKPASDFKKSMGAFQRTVLRRALSGLPSNTQHRRYIAEMYRSRITSGHVRHVDVPAAAQVVYGRYPLLTERKQDLLRRAPAARVELADFYDTPVHPLNGSALKSVAYREGSCPRAEALTRLVVSLPTAPNVGQRDVERAVALFASV